MLLEINTGSYSFEAANARHEHEWKVWQDVKLPEGKVLVPGVVTHSTNVIEHPELVADRIERFAQVVGRENVIAATDCGLGGRVHQMVAWAKLATLAEGANWRRSGSGDSQRPPPPNRATAGGTGAEMTTTTAQLQPALIGGERRGASSGETIDVVNPATGEVIARDSPVRCRGRRFGGEGRPPCTEGLESARAL